MSILEALNTHTNTTDATTTPSSTTTNHHNDGEWTCSECSLINVSENEICSVCDTPQNATRATSTPSTTSSTIMNASRQLPYRQFGIVDDIGDDDDNGYDDVLDMDPGGWRTRAIAIMNGHHDATAIQRGRGSVATAKKAPTTTASTATSRYTSGRPGGHSSAPFDQGFAKDIHGKPTSVTSTSAPAAKRKLPSFLKSSTSSSTSSSTTGSSRRQPLPLRVVSSSPTPMSSPVPLPAPILSASSSSASASTGGMARQPQRLVSGGQAVPPHVVDLSSFTPKSPPSSSLDNNETKRSTSPALIDDAAPVAKVSLE
jgi:hypothetical protein